MLTRPFNRARKFRPPPEWNHFVAAWFLVAMSFGLALLYFLAAIYNPTLTDERTQTYGQTDNHR